MNSKVNQTNNCQSDYHYHIEDVNLGLQLRKNIRNAGWTLLVTNISAALAVVFVFVFTFVTPSLMNHTIYVALMSTGGVLIVLSVILFLFIMGFKSQLKGMNIPVDIKTIWNSFKTVFNRYHNKNK